MVKEILANVDPFEIRVAVLEDGVLAGIMLERGEPLAGNVYKGRVSSVLPGMEAAFVDIGLGRNAFLHVQDVRSNRIEPFRGQGGEELEDQIGRGPIAERLRVGQEILVQVTKEPRGTKGARATTYVALPGHYLVLMPTVTGIGVSRRIANEPERKRLRAIAERLRPEGMGLIVRTAAEGVEERDLADDVRFLLQLWAQVTERAASSRAPAVLYQDLGLIRRVVRDLFTGEVDRFVVDSPREFERVRELVGGFAPELRDRVQLHAGPEPIFDANGIEREIERALHRKVWLRSGGYLVFDRTEAATVIDVNTGKYVGKTDLASTILKTNLEAAAEIARQIRLRDIGGIILVDFIDMDSDKHRRARPRRPRRGGPGRPHQDPRARPHGARARRDHAEARVPGSRGVDADAVSLLRGPGPGALPAECRGARAPGAAPGRGDDARDRGGGAGAPRRGGAAPRGRGVAAGARGAGGSDDRGARPARHAPGPHRDRARRCGGDDAEVNGQQDGKRAQAFWLDPIHGEGMDLPEDDDRARGSASRAAGPARARGGSRARGGGSSGRPRGAVECGRRHRTASARRDRAAEPVTDEPAQISNEVPCHELGTGGPLPGFGADGRGAGRGDGQEATSLCGGRNGLGGRRAGAGDRAHGRPRAGGRGVAAACGSPPRRRLGRPWPDRAAQRLC